MITIREQFEVAAPLEQVWPLLSDPSFVVTCVPGATLVADRGGDTYDGALSVKFGPVVATFNGTAQIKFDHPGRSCTIEARGQDQRGASRASASAAVTTTEQDGRTTVLVEGGFTINGPLAQFARTGGQHLAREMLAEFSRNLAQRLAPSAPTGEAKETIPLTSQPARQLSGFGLMWRVLLRWMRGLLGRRTHLETDGR